MAPLVALATVLFAAPAHAADARIYDVSLGLDGAVIAAGAIGGLIPYVLANDLIEPRCPCNRDEVNGFDRWVIGNHSETADIVSTVTAALAVAGPLLLDGLDAGSFEAWWPDALVLVEALALTSALTSITKVVVQRPLPRVYAGDPDLIGRARGYRSFFSGHTAITFAALSTAAYTYTLRHGPAVWLWLVVAGVGVSVAAERLAAGLHFPTDVLVGAAVGTAVGILVPALHRRAEAERATGLMLTPAPGGLGLTLRF